LKSGNANGASDEVGRTGDEQDPVASGLSIEPSLQQKEDHEVAEAYVGDDKLTSDDHKAVSFAEDVKSQSREKDEDDSQQPDRRNAFARIASGKTTSSRRLLTFRQLLMQRNQPTKKRHRTIQKIDTWCFWILSSTYVLFVVLMFATTSLWNDGNQLYVEGDPPNTGP